MRMHTLAWAWLMMLAVSAAASCDVSLLTGGANMQYVGLAFMVTILLTVFAYIGGTVLGNPQLLLFSKDQLFHLALSAVLVVSVAAIMQFSCIALGAFLDFALQNTLPGGTSLCYQGHDALGIARCYIGALKNEADATLQATIRESISKEMSSGFVFGLYNPITGGVMIPTAAYRKTESMQLDTVGNTFLLPALVSLNIQKTFLEFSLDFVKYLIPAALFFRVLPGFRKMGNLLIALALALYVIVPTLYALNSAMDDVVFKNGCDANNPAQAVAGQPNPLPALVQDGVMGSCPDRFGFWEVARFLPQAYFLPNLVLAVTITFLAGINKALRVLA